MTSSYTRALPPGTLLHDGRFQIQAVLGEGGFGITYRVLDRKYNQVAAIKEYMPRDIAFRPNGQRQVIPQTGGDCPKRYQSFLEKFEREANVIHSFGNHPNIVHVHFLFRENNTSYYAMEYIDGMDLQKLLDTSGNRITWQQLLPILAQTVTALDKIHAGGIIHCDISPDNIFVLRDGRVKLIDFGASKSILRNASEVSTIAMKPHYAPPEQQVSGKDLDTWTDVYALGVTIYRCITGTLPPTAADRLTGDNTRWPSQLGFPIPSPQWETALQKAMALRIRDRFATVREFWQALCPGGYSQPRSYAGSYAGMGTRAAPVSLRLKCVQGIYLGSAVNVRDVMLLGTDRERCQILFPPGHPGISRVHLKFWVQNGTICAMDMGSTYGSWLNRQPMQPGMAYPMPPGAFVYIGNGQVFQVEALPG